MNYCVVGSCTAARSRILDPDEIVVHRDDLLVTFLEFDPVQYDVAQLNIAQAEQQVQ
jgi:hypothetical protein